MKVVAYSALLMSVMIASSPALTPEDFSPAARALLPSNQVVVVELKDGQKIQGPLVENSSLRVVVRIEKGGGITAARAFPKLSVRSVKPLDAADLLAAALLHFFFVAVLGRLPRFMGWVLTGAYAVFLYKGLGK